MKNKIIIIMLLIVCITVMCFSLCSSVFAAELDSEAIYNFNQMLNISIFSNGSNAGYTYSVNSNTVHISGTGSSVGNSYIISSNFYPVLSHVYYIDFGFVSDLNVGTFGFVGYNNSSPSYKAFSSNNFYYFGELNYDRMVFTIISNTVYYDFYLSPIVIDLTQMFGRGNEPTLEQSQKIFTSEYYNYTTGTPLSLSGVNAYQQGVSDTLNSYDVVTYPSITVSNMFGINSLGYSTKFQSFDGSSYQFILDGYVGIPFGASLPANTNVRLYFSNLEVHYYTSNTTLQFGYLNSNNFIPLYTVDYSSVGTISGTDWSWSDFYIDFILPVDLEYLVLYCPDLVNGGSLYLGCIGNDFYYQYKTFNNQVLIDNAYNTGYNAGSTAGYNNAYQQGYTAGLADGTNNDYSFLGLISSVIEAPVNVLIGEYDSSTGLRIGGLLNFDFLGYNMSTLLMSLFSLGVVICIIRLFI